MSTTDTPVDGAAEGHEDAHRAVVRETVTMGLYIAVSLLSVLLTVPATESRAAAIALVWGSAAGFTLAHWLAFQLAARIYAGAHLDRHDRVVLLAQALAAAVVAAVATVPLALGGDDGSGLGLARLTVAGLLGLVAYAVASRHGSGRGRAILYAAVAMTLAVGVAVVKNLLAGH